MISMRLLLGGAIGYVLGARAGREKYDQLLDKWEDFKQTDLYEKVAGSASQAGDAVSERATGTMNSMGESGGESGGESQGSGLDFDNQQAMSSNTADEGWGTAAMDTSASSPGGDFGAMGTSVGGAGTTAGDPDFLPPMTEAGTTSEAIDDDSLSVSSAGMDDLDVESVETERSSGADDR